MAKYSRREATQEIEWRQTTRRELGLHDGGWKGGWREWEERNCWEAWENWEWAVVSTGRTKINSEFLALRGGEGTGTARMVGNGGRDEGRVGGRRRAKQREVSGEGGKEGGPDERGCLSSYFGSPVKRGQCTGGRTGGRASPGAQHRPSRARRRKEERYKSKGEFLSRTPTTRSKPRRNYAQVEVFRRLPLMPPLSVSSPVFYRSAVTPSNL